MGGRGRRVLGLWLLSGAGDDFNLRGDGLVFLCAFSLAAHILATAGAVRRYDVGALLAVQLGVVGVVSWRSAPRPATSRRREGGDGLVGADRDRR